MKLVPPSQAKFEWWETHPEHGFDWNAYRKIEERLIKSGKLKELDVLHRVVDEDELVRAKDARFLKQNPSYASPTRGSEAEMFQDSVDKIAQDPEFKKFENRSRKNHLTKEPLKLAQPWYREAAITRNAEWPKMPQQVKEGLARQIVEQARGGPFQIWPDQFEKKFGLRPGEVYFEGAPGVPRKLDPVNDFEGLRPNNPRQILKDPRFAPAKPSPWRGVGSGLALGGILGLFDRQTEMARMGEDSWDPKYAEPGVDTTPEVFRAVGNAYSRVRGRK